MSELAADGIPVAVTCRVLKLARQPYYRWLTRPVTRAELVLPITETPHCRSPKFSRQPDGVEGLI